MRMNDFLKASLLYTIALLQGIAFVIFPAASVILTSSNYQNLSSNEYGTLFIPMILGAVFISGVGGPFAKKYSVRSLLIPGVILNAFSMAGLAATEGFLEMHKTIYFMLLISMFFLGSGFGATLTSLNTLIIEQFPSHSATALTSLHAVLGIGTALAPKIVNLFVDIDRWWLAPFSVAIVQSAVFFLLLLATNIGTKIKESTLPSSPLRKPRLIWIFLAITFFYGICETVIGNWSPIYLHQVKGMSVTLANDALSMFWALVTVGRIFTSIMTAWISYRWFYAALPPLVILAFILVSNTTSPDENILMLGVAGLACSAILPLSIGFGEEVFPQYRELVSGSLISSYMAGYGVAAYGTGGLHSLGLLPLNMMFFYALIPALTMAILTSFALLYFRPLEQ